MLYYTNTGGFIMKNNFNKHEFEKAITMIKTDPYEAKHLLEEYLEKYPRDLFAKSYYIYILLVLDRIDEAEKLLEEIEIEVETNSFLHNNPVKLDYVMKSIKLSKLRILGRKKQYKEFIDFYTQNHIILDDKNITFIARHRLGLNSNLRNYQSYYFNQIVDYQESDFIEHVLRHTADFNQDLEEPNSSIFVPGFPLEDIISEIKKYIPSDKKLCFGFFEDTYVFRYDGCGRNKNKLVNYFVVICCADDDNHFITMCPSNHCDNLPYVDLNYMRKEEQEKKPKTKVLSQIDKFNRRWGQKRN